MLLHIGNTIREVSSLADSRQAVADWAMDIVRRIGRGERGISIDQALDTVVGWSIDGHLVATSNVQNVLTRWHYA